MSGIYIIRTFDLDIIGCIRADSAAEAQLAWETQAGDGRMTLAVRTTEMRAMRARDEPVDRLHLEWLVWRHALPDYKCVSEDGAKQVLVNLDGATALMRIDMLPAETLLRQLPESVRAEVF